MDPADRLWERPKGFENRGLPTSGDCVVEKYAPERSDPSLPEETGDGFAEPAAETGDRALPVNIEFMLFDAILK